MRIPTALLGLCLCSVVACSPKADTPPPTRDAAAQRAVDSTIGASRLPGAQGVRGALKVSDSAAARRALMDSLAGNP